MGYWINMDNEKRKRRKGKGKWMVKRVPEFIQCAFKRVQLSGLIISNIGKVNPRRGGKPIIDSGILLHLAQIIVARTCSFHPFFSMLEVLDLIFSSSFYPDPVRNTKPCNPWMVFATIFEAWYKMAKIFSTTTKQRQLTSLYMCWYGQRGISSSRTPSLAYSGHQCSF